MSLLEVKDVIKSFNKNQILNGVSFNVEKGEVVSIIGPSGNGKTTLLRCLNGLEKIDSGSICVNSDSNGRKFGLVFQDFNLFPQYTALDNITLAMNIGKTKEEKANNKKIAEDLLDKVGLLDKKNFYPSQLSGGQKQRVAIARALALSPDVLCFDEPTSALDPSLTNEVLKVIKALKDENRTMIIVTHEMSFAKNVSDKIIFMFNGIIEEMGSPSEIFDNPKSEKLKEFLNPISGD